MTNNQGHIFVVDDSPRNRLKLSRFLQQQGHTVTEAENGRQALEILSEQSFDLMLLDIIMLGQLARVFQHMAHEVHTRQQDLKDQVQKASQDRYKFGDIIDRSPDRERTRLVGQHGRDLPYWPKRLFFRIF